MKNLWNYISNPQNKLWAVTTKKDYLHVLVMSAPIETVQEPYVEESFQEEGLILLFTTKDGADSHAKFLVKQWGFEANDMGLTSGNLNDMLLLVDKVNNKAVQEIGRSIRAEIYHMDGDDCTKYDILYSHWITKH